jgi:hypothetical protein
MAFVRSFSKTESLKIMLRKNINNNVKQTATGLSQNVMHHKFKEQK